MTRGDTPAASVHGSLAGSPAEISRAFLLCVAFGSTLPAERLAAAFPARTVAEREAWLAEFARVDLFMGQLAESGAAGDFERIEREVRTTFPWVDGAAASRIGGRVGWIAWHEGHPFSRR